MELVQASSFNTLANTSSAVAAPLNPAINHLGTNPLTGLAAKLFSVLTQLKKSIHSYQPEVLRQYLTNELNKFAEQAKTLDYKEEHILVSQYILCYTFDKTIASSTWGQHHQWQQTPLMQTLPHAGSIEQNFNSALKKMCQLPEVFIDILELIFICLKLTRIDKHSDIDLTWQTQENLSALYQVIQQQRGEFEKSLSKKTDKQIIRKRKSKKISLSLLISTSILIIIGMYTGFTYMADKASLSTVQVLNSLK